MCVDHNTISAGSSVGLCSSWRLVSSGLMTGCRSRAVKTLRFAGALGMVPSGVSHRGPTSIREMSLVATSGEAAGLEMSVPLAKGLSGPLCCCRSACLATNSVYAAQLRQDRVAGCSRHFTPVES
jgi:hypothetical protein